MIELYEKFYEMLQKSPREHIRLENLQKKLKKILQQSSLAGNCMCEIKLLVAEYTYMFLYNFFEKFDYNRKLRDRPVITRVMCALLATTESRGNSCDFRIVGKNLRRQRFIKTQFEMNYKSQAAFDKIYAQPILMSLQRSS